MKQFREQQIAIRTIRLLWRGQEKVVVELNEIKPYLEETRKDIETDPPALLAVTIYSPAPKDGDATQEKRAPGYLSSALPRLLPFV